MGKTSQFPWLRTRRLLHALLAAGLALPMSLAFGDDLQDRFNTLFQKGKYDEAERLLESEGPSSPDPTVASQILESLRKFRNTDQQRDAAIIIHNPTGSTLTYSTRMGDGEWHESEIEPFKSWRHFGPVNRDGESRDGKFQIRFKPSSESDEKTYDLDSTIGPKGRWEDVKKYYFGPAKDESGTTYRVTGVADDDTLNIRSGPGTDNDIVATLAPGSGSIEITGDSVYQGSDDWVPITFPGGSGWTRPKFLTAESSTSSGIDLYRFSGFGDGVAAVKISNRTSIELKYKYRWSNSNEWTSKTLQPGWNQTFWYDYYGNVTVSPDFLVEFDEVGGDDEYTAKVLKLERHKTTRDRKDDEAKKYYFEFDTPSSLKLYSE